VTYLVGSSRAQEGRGQQLGLLVQEAGEQSLTRYDFFLGRHLDEVDVTRFDGRKRK